VLSTNTIEVAFSANDKRIAVLSNYWVTICDIMHPENRLSFDPWPKGRRVRNRQVAFQTRNGLVICAQLEDLDSYEISGLLQVWEVKDHSECMFSLDITIGKWFPILLAPDGLTVITRRPLSCYSWDHNTSHFDRIDFADEAHLDGVHTAYSPDRKFFACCSDEDKHVRVWNT